ncbi:hypothetical protein SLS62_010540 [Diatrype stigma]|uniref:HhH-GPD domain-containing protein n=1 Tax=Diatrype stigma TaxID=117547 RepID=A0AAN9UBL3_9PEZI
MVLSSPEHLKTQGSVEITTQVTTQPLTRTTRAKTRAAAQAEAQTEASSTQLVTSAEAITATNESNATTHSSATSKETIATTTELLSQLPTRKEVPTSLVLKNPTPTTSTIRQHNEDTSQKRKHNAITEGLLRDKGVTPLPKEVPDTNHETGLRRSKRIKALAPKPNATQESATQEDATQEDATQEDATQEGATQEDATQEDAIQESKSVPILKERHTSTKGSSDNHTTEHDPKPKKEKRKPKKTKDNPYGLMPGETPFPEWTAPNAAQCEEVYRLLAEMHDDVKPQAPEVIPAPSLDVAGCGEVPSVLDALLRTLLSGATTFDNADKMIKGLVDKFGILEDGIGKGSINWNQARLSPIEDVVDAIRVGGLGNNKAKSIKAILDIVYQETVERRDAYLEERKTGVKASVIGASVKTKGQKDLEILKVEKNILSLDHIRDLSVDEAMKELTKYPGVGVKTSACVILFCLQRPCFAVDTHVDKFSKWLRWVPEKATVDDVFSHLEVRCPDHLKYGLHQLFIRHGKTCGKCRRHTVEGTEEWKTLVCPLEHLLDRFDKRQSKAKPKPVSKKQQKVGAGEEEPGGNAKDENIKVKDEDADGLDGLEGGIADTAEEAVTRAVKHDDSEQDANGENGESGAADYRENDTIEADAEDDGARDDGTETEPQRGK